MRGIDKSALRSPRPAGANFEKEVNGRTNGTKLWRLNKARAGKRHRNTHNGKMELFPALTKNAPAKNFRKSLLRTAK